MKRTIATLIAGLFATAAFAQTPAPASTVATTATAKADAKDTKQEAKQTKKVARHHPMVKQDATVATTTTVPATAAK